MFIKGQCANPLGRKKGVANKVTKDVRALAQNLFNPAYWTRTAKRLASGKLHPLLEKTLLAYAYGEPKKTLKLEGEVGVQEKRDFMRGLSDEFVRELAMRAAVEPSDDPETVN